MLGTYFELTSNLALPDWREVPKGSYGATEMLLDAGLCVSQAEARVIA